MRGKTHIKTWVSADVKERLVQLARALGKSESALMRTLLKSFLENSAAVSAPIDPVDEAPSGRLSVRIREDDRLILRERALARGMSAATYVSFVLRSHLRRLAPLPDRELKLLKSAVAELSAVGRNLNQIARAANAGQAMRGEPTIQDLHALLRVCTVLRDAWKEVLVANLASWEAGHETPSR
jgi:predicted transcriptional regulator